MTYLEVKAVRLEVADMSPSTLLLALVEAVARDAALKALAARCDVAALRARFVVLEREDHPVPPGCQPRKEQVKEEVCRAAGLAQEAAAWADAKLSLMLAQEAAAWADVKRKEVKR